MDDVVRIAKDRADQFGVKTVVVATNSGASAEHALEVFGPGYLIIAVGNPSSAHDRGLVVHAGISDQTAARLESLGIKTALADQSFVQKYHDHPSMCRGVSELDSRMRSSDPLPVFSVVSSVLDWFSDAVRVCIEVTSMAADAAVLPAGQDCVAIARPIRESNCPHAAVILTPVAAEDMFRGGLRIKDIVLVPGENDHWFSNQPLWQG